MTVTYDDAVRFVRTYAERIAERKMELTELDSAIGDADHGINMDRGFQAVLGKLEAPVKIRYYYSQSGSALPVARMLNPYPFC